MEQSPETRISLCEKCIEDLQEKYITVSDDIKDIKDNLLKRPSWPVTVIITILSSLCVGLIIFVVK